MTENQYAISEADIIILAVKPCIVDEVLSPLRFSRTQILVSLVTGISISHGTFIGNRNAYIPGSSQHRHYGTFEPDPDNFTQSRQKNTSNS